jgi:adenine C2-methylase RlmN of 23S rRNA A2503 and tRNA A37
MATIPVLIYVRPQKHLTKLLENSSNCERKYKKLVDYNPVNGAPFKTQIYNNIEIVYDFAKNTHIITLVVQIDNGHFTLICEMS